MSVLREGTEILTTPSRAGGSFASINGKCVFASDRQRPIVLSNDADGVSARLMGITRPGSLFGNLNIDVTTAGVMDGRIVLAAYRRNSKTGHYSAFSGTYPSNAPAPMFPGATFATLASRKILYPTTATAGIVANFGGDHETDTYDQIGFAVFYASVADWKPINVSNVMIGGVWTGDAYEYLDPTAAYFATIEQIELNESADTVKTRETLLPDLMWVPPASKLLWTHNAGSESQRIALAGQTGFDCFVDQPILASFSPAESMTADGIVSAPSTLVAYRDGTYIAIGYDANGHFLGKGFIVDSDAISDQSLGGDALEIYQVQLASNFERTVAIDGINSSDYTREVWYIRRQVVAHATEASHVVELSHDVSKTIEAKVLGQWAVWQNCIVEGVGALGSILKVASVAATGSLGTGETKGHLLILPATYYGETTYGLFSTEADNYSVWFGRGSATYWEGTSAKLRNSFRSPQPIVTGGSVHGVLSLVTKQNVLFQLDIGTIADPLNNEQFVAFDISQSVRENRFEGKFSAVAPWSFVNTQNEEGVWIGAEGPYLFDGSGAQLLAQDNFRTSWDELDSSSFVDARCVNDPMNAYSPLIRIGGIREVSGGARTVQLAWMYARGRDFLNYSNHGGFDAATIVLKSNGRQAVIFGRNGRVWMYGNPATEGADSSDDLYGYPRVPETRTGTCEAETYIGAVVMPTFQIRDDDADFMTAYGPAFWLHAGVNAMLATANGVVGTGTIKRLISSTQLEIEPDTWLAEASGPGIVYIVGYIATGTPNAVVSALGPISAYYQIRDDSANFYAHGGADFWNNAGIRVGLIANYGYIATGTPDDQLMAIGAMSFFYQLRDDSASFLAIGDASFWDGAGIRCVLSGDDGSTQYAVILSVLGETRLVVQPDSTWQKVDGVTYTYLIGSNQVSDAIQWATVRTIQSATRLWVVPDTTWVVDSGYTYVYVIGTNPNRESGLGGESIPGSFLVGDAHPTTSVSLPSSVAYGLFDADANFFPGGQGYFWNGSGVRVVKIGSDNSWEWATVIGFINSNTLRVEPDGSWVNNSGVTYTYIVGAREWKIELPEIVAQPPRRFVQIDSMQAEIEDTSEVEYPVKIEIYTSGVGPRSNTLSLTRYVRRANIQSQWQRILFSLPASPKSRIVVRGIAPSDSHLYIKSFSVDYIETE